MCQKSNFYSGKRVLVTGGSGMIGVQLVELLKKSGAIVSVVSLDSPKILNEVNFLKKDLRYFDNCLEVCKDKDIVFHLAGVKGSPKMNIEKPASFMVPTLMFSINMMEAALRQNVSHYLLTSSIGVYAQNSIFKEDSVWETFPSQNDRFPGWAKRICELQAEAYEIQHNWQNISIVRPSNVYGPFDNFDENNAMVIPSLIKKAFKAKDVLKVWGDGSAIRDFIYSKDVARGMMKVIKEKIKGPINLGNGDKTSIKEIVEIIVKNVKNSSLKVEWDTSQPKGDDIKLMDVSLANSFNFKPEIGIEEGLELTINWYKKYGEIYNNSRYNPFTESKKNL
jgi:GDP-L-fucose synthase